MQCWQITYVLNQCFEFTIAFYMSKVKRRRKVFNFLLLDPLTPNLDVRTARNPCKFNPLILYSLVEQQFKWKKAIFMTCRPDCRFHIFWLWKKSINNIGFLKKIFFATIGEILGFWVRNEINPLKCLSITLLWDQCVSKNTNVQYSDQVAAQF